MLRPLERLTPVFELEGREFLFVTPELAGMSRSVLGRKVASEPAAEDFPVALRIIHPHLSRSPGWPCNFLLSAQP